MPYASYEARRAYFESDHYRQLQNAAYQRRKFENPFNHRAVYVGTKARSKRIPFDLDGPYLESIWTGHCAISSMPIDLHGDRKDEHHAELDRIDPTKGYTKGNVAWLSRKYNRMKSDNSIDDLKLIIKYLDTIKKNYGT